MEKPFEGRVTRNAAVLLEKGTAYDEIVSSIMKLHPDDWFSEGQAAVKKEQLQTGKGAELLQAKLVHAFEAASKAQLAYSEILREGHSLESNTYAFMVFKTWTLAKILSEKPHLAAQLKTEVSNRGYNLGYTKICEWIDVVAENPKRILEDVAILCSQVDLFGLEDGIKLRETLVSMAHHFEYDYEELCRIFPEYKSVPVVPVEEENISSKSRVTRSKR